MLVIRFLRIGKKKQPFFRIVVTDKKNPPRGGRFLENVGFFNPKNKERKLNVGRIKYWLSVGAKPSARVYNLLILEGIIKGKKIAVHKKTTKKGIETEETKESSPQKITEKPVENQAEKQAEKLIEKLPEDKKEASENKKIKKSVELKEDLGEKINQKEQKEGDEK